MRTILVVGISGVGKSWLCRQAVASLGFRHVSASELIRTVKERLTSQIVSTDQLRTDRVVDNQELLLAGLRAYEAQDDRAILFDGHNVVDTDDGLVKIPFEVITALRPAAIVMIVDAPDAIVRRRSTDPTRARPNRSAEDLSTYQDLCLELAKAHAEALAVPMTSISSGETDKFISFLRSVDCRRLDEK
ncbi:AAA family ATPase [Agrobacterium rhizogenes]|uniref:ATP-binding protein n=1 Tax=Rhizobium rhizogenes TaxID=359 RepID=UPI001571F50F|nr:AAA family ATPase [Rhizobium rhizogenes]NTG91011.1 AAA family ATPase [Rhizobium rhizogenes]NTI20284.1 AAA family ATPase [Rhizobium rhizogenes]NTI39332.1 AAA family ATPase [Rhizobium rhizogenes]WEO68950.1 AAA family ATPase [Rhizobium rhizogenes]